MFHLCIFYISASEQTTKAVTPTFKIEIADHFFFGHTLVSARFIVS